jgi:hypothetical protein
VERSYVPDESTWVTPSSRDWLVGRPVEEAKGNGNFEDGAFVDPQAFGEE